MVSRAIEQAQIKVEGFHFDARKRVVEYDDVMNKQREIIYKRRKGILEIVYQMEQGQAVKASSLKDQIIDNIEADIDNFITMYAQEGLKDIEYEHIVRDFAEIVPFDLSSQKKLEVEMQHDHEPDKISKKLKDIVNRAYSLRETLRTIDRRWMDHLDNLDNLRDGIGLRGYGQRDPLVEYKNEAFTMFEQLLSNIDYEIGRQIFRIGVAQQSTMPAHVIATHPAASQPETAQADSEEKQRDLAPQFGGRPVITSTVRHNNNQKRLGRNDPCPCGSGKKWKKCHYPQLG